MDFSSLKQLASKWRKVERIEGTWIEENWSENISTCFIQEKKFRAEKDRKDPENWRVVRMPLSFRRILKHFRNKQLNTYSENKYISDRVWETFERWSSRPYKTFTFPCICYLPGHPGFVIYQKNLCWMNFDVSRICATVLYAIIRNKSGKHGHSVNGKYQGKRAQELFSELHHQRGYKVGVAFLGQFLWIIC